jgi:hypothetical protein
MDELDGDSSPASTSDNDLYGGVAGD